MTNATTYKATAEAISEATAAVLQTPSTLFTDAQMVIYLAVIYSS